MTRNIHFRKDIYKTVFCVFDYFPDIVLGIKSSVIARFIRCRCRKFSKCSHTLYIPCAYFSEPGQTFNLYTPALIISQVQMQQIEFISHHIINKILDLLLGKEMARHIKHQPPPSKTGVVCNFYRRSFP